MSQTLRNDKTLRYPLLLLKSCPANSEMSACFLVSAAFGRFQGIEFLCRLFRFFYNVRGHIACAQAPLGSWIREGKAVLSAWKDRDFLAALALLDNWMAGAAVKLAALLVHKNTVISYFNGSANHGNHILSLEKLKEAIKASPKKQWKFLLNCI